MTVLRPRRLLPVLGDAVSFGGAVRFFSLTRDLRQIQARDTLICGTHGAGVVKHDSMAAPPAGSAAAAAAVAAPAADLFRTKVHEGTGTGPKDPYLRTLPNIVSRAPESSVSSTCSATAATVDECGALGRKWGGMHYWLGDQHPRLMAYLRQLLVLDVPPLSPAAESLLSSFETSVIPKLLSNETDGQKLADLWKETVAEADALRLRYVFDRDTFQFELAKICDGVLQKMQDTLSLRGKESLLAVEALRRQSILARNKYIQEHLIDVVENGAYFGFGDAIWRVFFSALEANKAELFSKNTADVIKFAWDAIMQEDVVRLPDVTAPVALYLTLVSIRESEKLTMGKLKESSVTLDEGINHRDTKQEMPSLFLLNPILKRRFVSKTAAVILEKLSCNKFSKLLRECGLHDLSREVSLAEAANSNTKALEEDIVDVVSVFENKNEVKTLLSSLIGGNDVLVRDTVARTLGISTVSSINWDILMESVDWTSNWRRLATSLLSEQGVLVAIYKLVKNAIGAKGVSRNLFSEEYADKLHKVITLREEREAARKLRVDSIVQTLSSYENVDKSCDIFRQLGVDMKELDEAAHLIREKGLVKRPRVDDNTLATVLREIAVRHPNWIRAGVITPKAEDSTGALQIMLRIFIRLAYIPQTGAAALAQRSRRRIGPVGLEPHQFNVPTEIGIVEHYDNLKHKRYDWQGWYQRMVDVHNRNVSLRCRISDLKRLDGNGVPFVDMQTERRLRILAQGRVGMGVLMLDSDKYEDQSDNMTFGETKLSELFSDARKAQLGEEYWPSVELKVRRPSGQSKAHYSLIDYERVEKRSKELYEKYRDAKKKSLFVTPMEMWLEVKGVQVRKAAGTADADGYTVDSLQDVLNSEDSQKN